MWCLITNLHIESFIPQTALCKIHDDLVSNTYHGSPLFWFFLIYPLLLIVDHQLLLSDFSDCGVEGTALSLVESYLENRNSVWL